MKCTVCELREAEERSRYGWCKQCSMKDPADWIGYGPRPCMRCHWQLPDDDFWVQSAGGMVGAGYRGPWCDRCREEYTLLSRPNPA